MSNLLVCRPAAHGVVNILLTEKQEYASTLSVPGTFGSAFMTQANMVQAFRARLLLYGLDDRARRIITEIWPTIATNVEQGIDKNLAASELLPHVGQIIVAKRELIKELELAHFRIL